MHEENRQLEDFLAKILEKEDFPFSEEDWETVAAQLDQEEAKKSKRRILFFWLSAAAIALLFTTFMLGWWWGISSKLKPYENRMAQPDKIIQSPNRNIGPPSGYIGDSLQNASLDSLHTRTLSAESVPDRVALSQQKKDLRHQLQPQGVEAILIGKNDISSKQDSLFKVDYSVVGIDYVIPQLTSFETYPPDWVNLQEMPIQTPTKQPKAKQHWGWALLASPDYSATRLSGRESNNGFLLGAMVEYKVDRIPGLSLLSGVRYSQKNYLALRSDYLAPTGFWKYKIAPQSIEASCNILDIPLSLRYIPFSQKQRAFFISGGLSSFFMLNEDYEYYYEKPNDKLLNYLEIRNENQYLFNGLNFSAGYKVPLKNKSRLVLEPYLYLPIQRIGHGRVNLYSYGLQLGYEGRSFIGMRQKNKRN